MTEICKEYGTALFMLACENDKKKEYKEALETVENAFNNEPLYMDFLCSHSISMNERLSALEEAFSAKIPEDIVSFLALLCEKGRISGFYSAVEEYNRLYAESERVLKAKITSVVQLTEDEKEKLCKKLQEVYACNIEAEYYSDASLIGGIVIEADGMIIDGSIKRRLNGIKEVINA